MTEENKETNLETKAANNTRIKYINNDKDENKKLNARLLMLTVLFSGVLLIISTYAWLSASLDVKVRFFDMTVSSDSGLFISLDGIDFSDSVEISSSSVISKLRSTYPTHINQWSTGGLWPVSTNGISSPNKDKFDIYVGDMVRYKDKNKNIRRFLNTRLMKEERPSALNLFIAFDLFFKNVSGSPKSDNLYFDEGTYVDFEDDTSEEVRESMSGIMNSMRFGIVKVGSVSSKSDINTIRNIKCNNNCEMVIYEPNSKIHSETSIEAAKELGIDLVDGEYNPTYAVINAGKYLAHANGQEGTGIALDTEHFKLQETYTEEDYDKPIFQVPNGITKTRVYVWIEGQDIDSLETLSDGADIYISMNMIKDLAGYE